jgi:RHS repeat-associated protein
MENKPEDAFRCGPMALDRILAFSKVPYDRDKIKNSASTIHGMSLTQVLELSRDLGMKFQMAHRSVGADVVFPGVVHWKAGHYAALLREEGGRFLVQDPTFGDEFWVSHAALDEQSSGYFLIPDVRLPAGWQKVEAVEGNQVWGKGNTSQNDKTGITGMDNKAHQCPCAGMGGNAGPGSGGAGGKGPQAASNKNPAMASYDIHLMLVNLNITDTPVGYAPPRGPVVEFIATYNQKESFQPSVFSYSNLGPQWTFNWMSYVKDDPSNLTASSYVYLEGGSDETYSGFNSSTQSYQPQFMSHAVLARTSTSPIRYERRLLDGAVEVFAQPDGAATFPRRIFMTEWHDALGNAMTFTYDSSLRLVAVTDAIGQVTTLSYGLSSDPLKITQVTDPFGRSATFDYNYAGRLIRITDVIGLQSQFGYTTGDFINTLTTPYGMTVFQYGELGQQRWLEATDPMGGTERVEFRHSAPGIPDSSSIVPSATGLLVANTYQSYRNSFYWDKHAWANYRGDYTKATLYHWLHTIDMNVTSRILEGVKPALENRIWYAYPGQVSGWDMGTSSQASYAARVLDDGSTQLYKYEYNAVGKLTKVTDPLNRVTIYGYGTNNVLDSIPATGTGIDLLQVQQQNGASTDLLESMTYNAQHQPLTMADAAVQTTNFSYDTNGNLQTVVTPPRGSLTLAQRTTTYLYYADNASLGPGRLQQITGPISGATTSFAYDGYGRVHTATESDGYALTTDYDNFDRPTQLTYPDGTYEQRTYNRLDIDSSRDRLGRWTRYFYDAVRHLILTRDPLGQVVTYQWCICDTLDKLIDANGNATSWARDPENRLTSETRADSTQTLFTYENTTSRLKRRMDAKGQYRDTAYFKDDTVQQISYPNSSPTTPTVSFTYESAYKRLATMVDGTGTTSYTYYPVTIGGTLGATQLATVTGPLSNSTIAYSYDELGRLSGRSINSVAATSVYDELGRVTSVTNALGSFTYGYVNQTSRLQSVTYPNGQTGGYSYFPNSGDHRLQEILNQKTGSVTISKFDYTYDPVGNIQTWTQQTDSNQPNAYDLLYDATDQLTNATWRTTDTVPAILKRYGYSYDPTGNRTTEQLDDVPLKTSYNTMNRMLSQDPGGITRFAGTLSEAAKVTVQGKPATVSADNKFAGTVVLTGGTNSVTVQATDYSGNTRSNTYQATVSGSSKSFTYDNNGNLTGDGTRTFEWDAENRLTAVNSGVQRSEFTYDGLSRRVRIVEKTSGATTSDMRFLWCDEDLCEQRDSTGATSTARFFPQGEQQGTDAFFYTRDHLGSIREVIDSSGSIRARYDYDSFGRTTKLTGDKDASFSFTGDYVHSNSGLLLTHYRAYDATLGRWLSEDPLSLSAGDLDLYRYVGNQPILKKDPTGQFFFADDIAGIYLLAAAGALLTSAVAAYYAQHGPPTIPGLLPLPSAGHPHAVPFCPRENTADQDAAIQLAKEAKRKGGLSPAEAEALLDLAKEAGVEPVRGPETHPDRPQGKDPHIHVGPVDHIPVK